MNDFILYALKSVLSLALFLIVYRVLLMDEGNFRLRRIYLLISVNLALILPFFNFSLPFGEHRIPSVVLDEVTVYSNGIRLIKETSSFPLSQFVQYVYFSVTALLIFRVILNTIMVAIVSARNTPEQNEQVRLFLLKDKNISYSFFRNVFIGETSDKAEQDRILAHEKVHALQLHSIDVIYIETLTGLFWFNPFIWWFRDEIKNVHEYLADEGALANGFNQKEYQITLLEHLIGSASITITNNFNYSLIKNRIAMMNKQKSGRKNTWKVLLLLPLSIVIAYAFTWVPRNQVRNETEFSLNQKSKKAYLKVDQMPEYQGGFEAMGKFIATNVAYPELAIKNNVQGMVMVQFVVDENGNIAKSQGDYEVYDENKKETGIVKDVVAIDFKPAEGSNTVNTEQYVDLLKKEAVRVISSFPAFAKPGMQDGKAVAVVFTIPINFRLK